MSVAHMIPIVDGKPDIKTSCGQVPLLKGPAFTFTTRYVFSEDHVTCPACLKALNPPKPRGRPKRGLMRRKTVSLRLPPALIDQIKDIGAGSFTRGVERLLRLVKGK